MKYKTLTANFSILGPSKHLALYCTSTVNICQAFKACVRVCLSNKLFAFKFCFLQENFNPQLRLSSLSWEPIPTHISLLLQAHHNFISRPNLRQEPFPKGSFYLRLLAFLNEECGERRSVIAVGPHHPQALTDYNK